MNNKKKIDSKINNIKDHLAEIIYSRRIKLGYSQQALADLCDVDRKTINRIENGHFSPNLDTLVRIFAALDIKAKTVFETN
jgi:DNA-binding XRE family transcriptional regulator